MDQYYLNPSMNNANKVAIVTGASSGIGLAVAKTLVNKGIKVYMVSHDNNRLVTAASKFESDLARPITVDVRSSKEVFKVVDKIFKDAGHIDYLINCAGVSIHGDFDKLEERDWDEVVDTNLKGIFLFCRAVWPLMKSAGNCQIITISSASGNSGYSGGSIYCASKFGTNGLMESLALEGQEVGIKVTNICPGQVDSAIWNPNDLEVNQARTNMLNTKAIGQLVEFVISRPWNEHYKKININPFAIQPYLKGRNKGPGGKFPEQKEIKSAEKGKTFRI